MKERTCVRCAALIAPMIVVCADPSLVHAREAVSTPPWSVTRASDPIYDTTNVKVVFSSQPDSLAGESVAARELRVTCLAGALDVSVDWVLSDALSAFASAFRFRNVELDGRVRFDDGTPRAMVWRALPGTGGAGVNNPRAFLEELARHQRVSVRVSRPDQPLTAVFDVAGAGPLLMEVRNGCVESAKEIGRVEEQIRRAFEAERELKDAIQSEETRLARLNPARNGYIAQIRQSIERNWLRPPGVGVGLKCVVRVVQIPGGEVVQAEIVTSSGNVAFDRSVEEAVLRASPLPEPKDPAWFDRHIAITFDPES